MIDIIRSIKNIALDMRKTTSRNDVRHEMLQDQIDLCDELLTHYIDDGR